MSYSKAQGFGLLDSSAGCGSSAAERSATQRMLNDLGYVGQDGKRLSTEGIWNDNSNWAMTAYNLRNALRLGQQQPIPFDSCDLLKKDWQQKTGMPNPAGTPAPSGLCPAGQINVLGVCVPNPFPGQTPPEPGTPASGACPPGQAGFPPFCAPNPFQGQPPPVPGPGPVPDPQTHTGMSKNTKIALGAGAALLVGVALYAAMSGKKSSSLAARPVRSGVAKTEMMTPNRRKGAK